MHGREVDVRELGERVKSLHGEAVYGFTLQCALAIATRNARRLVEAIR